MGEGEERALIGTKTRGWHRHGRNALLPLAALIGLAACERAPETRRVLEVRLAPSALSPDGPGDLLALRPASTPTSERLELHTAVPKGTHLTSGWRRLEGELLFRHRGTIRFWSGDVRPKRLRGRIRLTPRRQGATVRVWGEIAGHRLDEVEVTTTARDFSFAIPPGPQRVGTNVITLGRVGKGQVFVDELFLEDEERPDEGPLRPVELVVEDEAAPRRGLAVRGGGALAYLALLPRDPQRFELGLWCPAELSGESPRFEITAEDDAGPAVLLEGQGVPGRLQSLQVGLADFAGQPVQLGLTLSPLPGDARCAWVEPRLVPEDPTAPPDPASGARAGRANLIVILLDAATRERFGLYGSDQATTPALDALSRESLVFDRAVAQASYTLASTASLFTGRLPPVHRVTVGTPREPRGLPSSIPTFAEVLADAGYSTALVSGNPNAVIDDLARGFQIVETLYSKNVAVASEFHGPVLDIVQERLTEPFFLYVHYVQPHEPYNVAPPEFYEGLDAPYDGPFDGSRETMVPLFRGKVQADPADVARIRELYHGNLRYADWALGRLIEALREDGRLERSAVAITADHGESLGERDTFGHGRDVYRETSHIPLLMRFPARFGLTGRRRLPVGTVDILPTLLEFAGVTAPDGIEGRSVLRFLEDPGSRGWPRPLATWAGGEVAATVAVYGADSKYTFDSRSSSESLFSFEEQESGRDLRAERPVTFRYLAFSSFVPTAKDEPGSAAGPGTDIDPATVEALRALGYVE